MGWSDLEWVGVTWSGLERKTVMPISNTFYIFDYN